MDLVPSLSNFDSSFPRKRESSAASACADLSSRAALPSRIEAVGFRLQASYFLAAAPKSNQKAPPPDNRALLSQKKKRDKRIPCASRLRRGPATGHPWPDAGRFGILPRPAANSRRPKSDAGCDARRSYGGNVKSTATAKAQQHQKPGVTAFSPLSPWGIFAKIPPPGH